MAESVQLTPSVFPVHHGQDDHAYNVDDCRLPCEQAWQQTSKEGAKHHLRVMQVPLNTDGKCSHARSDQRALIQCCILGIEHLFATE
ncbi:MAG: hypothetical protein IJ852_03640 [Alphaproteobacteria bacterium]|nr:hypothetical protein [Alphaproteobacteria bacterium]